MVLSATHKTVFMEDGSHMGIPHDTFDQLQNEGISVVSDLIDFNNFTIDHISDNICHPAGSISDPNPGAALGATIPLPTLVFVSKS